MAFREDDELVTALVCTRDRPEALARAVRSLLATDLKQFELIVIDQSVGFESARAVAPSVADPRLRYVPTHTTGAGAALNEGLRLARGKILVCMDDDCEAPESWVSQMVGTLQGQPTAAVVFCNVTAAPHDRTAGYVPTYERRRSRLVRSVAATCFGHGLSAGMAVRRDVIAALGGFDPSLGPGSRFPAGDDWDLAFRALLNGWHVYETADVAVVHHGFRTLAEGRAHALRDWVGIGAVCAKLVRTFRISTLLVPIWEFAAHALWPPFADLSQLRRPSGGARIVGFVQGLGLGLRTPLDRKTLLFEPAEKIDRSQVPCSVDK